MYPKTLNRVHVFWGISGKTMGEGHRNKNIKNILLAMPVLRTCRWRCGMSDFKLGLESVTPHP